MLFGQHVALAESLTQYTSGDHQCAVEESGVSDSDAGQHVANNDFDDGIFFVLTLPVNAPVPLPQADRQATEFVSVVSPHYPTRAPPVL